MQQEMSQFIGEDLTLFFSGEVPVTIAPGRDGAHDPIDHLTQ